MLKNKRKKTYTDLLHLSEENNLSVSDMIQVCNDLLAKSKIHPHFFADNSILGISQYICFFVLGLPYDYTNQTYLQRILTCDETKKIIDMLEQRIATRTPLEYLTNEAIYLGNKFYVNHNVLVPRSIMNIRFEEFLQQMKWENHRVLDLCAGSGCIGISLALLDPTITVDLADISADALKVAAVNIDKYGMASRVKCIQSDLFSNINDKYDLIITNPPYVATTEYNKVPIEFKHEPRIALDAGKSGIEIIRRILFEAGNFLNIEGTLIAEVGYSSARIIKKLYPNVPFEWFKYKKPGKRESIFGMDGVFRCEASALT